MLVEVNAEPVGQAVPPAGLRVQVGIDAAITSNHHVCVRQHSGDGAITASRFTVAPTLAGLSRLTIRKSGKTKIVSFRWAADKQLRDAVCDFAADSRHASPWAAKLYNDAIARGHDHPHAVRILAGAWLYVIWRCWQDHVPYDPGKHRALQAVLAGDQQAA